MPSELYGVIDIGSNSVRLEIAKVLDSTFQTIRTQRFITRLGEGIGIDNTLSPSSINSTLDAINGCVEIAATEGVEPSNLSIVGTASLRKASNRSQILEGVEVDIKVLTPEEEAKYAFLGVTRDFNIEDKCVVVVDVGGGSTEIVTAQSSVITNSLSIPEGAVTLTARFNLADEVSDEQVHELTTYINTLLKENYTHSSQVDLLIATGGACSALSAMKLKQPEASLLQQGMLDGYSLSTQDLQQALNALSNKNAEARSLIEGIDNERAEIIIAGAALIHCVLRVVGVDSMVIHTGGVKRGILFQMMGVV